MSEKEYLHLIREIQEHDRLYYVENRPKISDYEYDQLYKKLEKIEKEHPEWVIPTSPTQRIGEPLRKGFKQVEHVLPMLSLANTYSEEEVGEFIARVHKLLETKKVDFCAELKMDGLAISARFEKGEFVRGLTRGNGQKGDDVTVGMRTIPSLPLQLVHAPAVLEVRGEVYMPHAVFDKLNREKEKEEEELWANPRNAAAGSLKLLDPGEVAKRGLCVVFYGIAEEEPAAPTKQFEVHEHLKKLGLPVFAPEYRVRCHNLEDIFHFARKVEKKRSSLPFDIDGIVIKVDELRHHLILGARGRSPRFAIAYKFAPEQAMTQIESITVQVGRSGILTPVAELKPVSVAGSTISRATLHNEEEVHRKDIREGDFVIIEKGGDVIPKVVSVDHKKRKPGTHPWKMPKHCPCCGTSVVRVEGEVAVRCPNKGCVEQRMGRLIHFAAKNALDIEHMGEKVIEQLVSKNLIHTPVDIYHLTADDLAKLDGFKEKSIQNLLDAIESSKKTALNRLIMGLGIKYVGEEIAEILAEKARSVEKLIEMNREEFLEIPGIGEKIAESLSEYFSDREHVKEILDLLKCGIHPVPPKVRRGHTGHPFSDKTFVLTGTLSKYTRQEASLLIKERGGHVSSSVSANTDFVLAGEEAGSKLKKAEKLGVRLMSEEEFEKLL